MFIFHDCLDRAWFKIHCQKIKEEFETQHPDPFIQYCPFLRSIKVLLSHLAPIKQGSCSCFPLSAEQFSAFIPYHPGCFSLYGLQSVYPVLFLRKQVSIQL